MYRKALRELKPSAQLLFSALVLVISGIVIMVPGVILGWMIFWYKSVRNGKNDSGPYQSSKYIITPTFSNNSIDRYIYHSPRFLIAWVLHGRPSVYLHYRKYPDFLSIIIIIAIIFCSNPLINWLNEINAKLTLPDWMNSVQIWMENSENQANNITEAFLKTTSVATLIVNLLMIGVLPSIGEELLFRGVVQGLLKKIYGNAHLAIWITAALFSALHLQFFGFLPRMALGIMFGYMLEWSGTLWLPIIAHFVNNTTAIIAYYLSNQGLISNNLDKTGTASDGSLYLAVISVIFLAFLFRSLYLRSVFKRVSGDREALI